MAFHEHLRHLCESAAAQGRWTLTEPELYGLLHEGGISVPRFYTVSAGSGSPETGGAVNIASASVVLKVVSPLVTHKTELGGVRMVENDPDVISAAVQEMMLEVRRRGGDEVADSVQQVLVSEFIEAEAGLGGELLAGLRWTPDMGHVVTIGFGGLDVEELSKRFGSNEALVLYSPENMTPEQGLEKFSSSFAYRKITGRTRAGHRLLKDDQLLRVLRFFGEVVRLFSNRADSGFVVKEFEVNPFFVSGGRCVAVDAFFRFDRGLFPGRTTDVEKLGRMLEPRTAAIVGVSNRGVNVGRVILRNLIREKFPGDQIRVVRAECEEIDGIACVDTVADLPWVADLLVVAVGARQVSRVVREVFASRRASALVIVAGGMGETEEGREEEEKVRKMLTDARASGAWAPVILGPNCLGILSRRGRYDTLFIPEAKLPRPEGGARNLALICQSGAFMITRMDGLPFLSPSYAISTGNQLDLTITDFMEVVVEDDEVDVIGLYIEGFKELDGLRLARLISLASQRGKDVLVYKAGRTSQGLTATSSHTASISSDYVACTEVLRDAGAFVAYSFRELKACLAVAALVHNCRFDGRGLGAMSNAGFETVGMADNLWEDLGFTLPCMSRATRDRIEQILRETHIKSLVTVQNPLDLTPMAPDRVYAECIAALLDDPGVHAVIMGIVPLTPSLRSLPPGVDSTGEDCIDHAGSLPNLLAPIVKASGKPVITSCDGGPLYDEFERAIHASGIPCFRTADFAMKTFQKFLSFKLRGKA
jgi:acyl-CoA synthetase (NDP forming)